MRAEQTCLLRRREPEQTQYRHEYKYPLTLGQIRIEEARIGGIMEKDAAIWITKTAQTTGKSTGYAFITAAARESAWR